MHHLCTVATVAAVAATAMVGCPDDDRGDAADADAALDSATGDTSEVGDTSRADAAEDTSLADSSTPDTAADTLVDTSGPWEWPWPEATVDVPAHASWKGRLLYPDEPFRSAVTSYNDPAPRWVKLTVFTGDPARVYFQDSNAYQLHYEFAKARLPPFDGLSHEAFDQLTLYDSPDRAAILGAVLYAPKAHAREIGVQLVSQDPLDPRVVDVLFDLIVDAVDPGDGGPVEAFYVPTFEQRAAVEADAAWYAALDIPVSGAERWAQGNACYARGWAVGRLTWVPGDQIDAAYAAGTLLPTDILLTDGVPAEIPYVAGVVTLSASTPSSHVAILSQTFGVPFAWLALAEDAAAAQALVGHEVALRATAEDGYGPCLVDLFDVDGLFDAAHRAELLALKAPAALDLPAKDTYGALTAPTDGLTSADSKYFGGKASNFGLLRRTIPGNTPDPALAISFDLWDAFMGQTLEGTGTTLRADIATRLAGYAWPPDMAALKADLAAVRDLVKGAAFTAAQRSDLIAALDVFDPDRKIRFRSSTNVEDTDTFVGAGLYSSYSGCLADDLDGDDAGPSLCDPSKPKERGVFVAIRKVFASFWNDNAFVERLRRGVDEGDVGMAVLVHHSFPDEIELANGVATLHKRYSLAYQLVTQLGAVSVTNPDTAAQPEVVSADIYGFGTALTVGQTSSLVALGDHVMTWEDDYLALVDLLEQVREAFAASLAHDSTYSLDFEYKRVVPGDLVVKQVRPLPRPSNEATVPTYLLPSATPLRRCVGQGEYGTVWSIHRAKMQLSLSNAGTWLDDASLAVPFYVDANLTLPAPSGGGGVLALTGAPSTWPDHAHVVDRGEATTSWTDGAGPDRRTFGLITAVTQRVAPARAPIFALTDLSLQVRIDYATPQFEIQWDGNPTTTSTDWVRLGACPDEEVITADHSLVSRTASSGDVTVETDFWWPPPPTGIVAGYTAPLAKWEQTRITGLTADPIVLATDWSQTYRPGHHNITEEFLFEPGREPGMPQATLDALAAADVWMVHVEVGYQQGQIWIVGFDGKRRTLKTE